MMSTTQVRARRALLITMLGIAMSGGIASAATIQYPGSKAWNSGTHLAVKDTAADGSNAYTNWNSSSNNRTETSGGYGSTADVYVNPLNNFRACLNISAAPDPCSGWVSP